MGTEVASIAARVGANTADFEKGMARAARSARNFSKAATKNLRRVTVDATKMGAAAVAAGAAMTAAIYVKNAKVIDSLAKTADALNLTTESLQALNHLAELNGVSAASMAKGLRRMEVNLGQAARQGGTAANALEDIGINIDEIIKLSPDKQIQTLSDAIAGVTNQSLKASIATDLFGRDGIAMLKVLNQIDEDGISPTIQKLKEYGVSISRIDAAKVEAANDAFFEAKQVLQGVATVLTVELAPYVQTVSELLTNAAKESQGFGDEVRAAINTAIMSTAKFMDFLRGLHVVFKGVELIAVGFGAAVVSAVQLAVEAIALFNDSVVKGVNLSIDALNMIPGVDIAKIDLFTDSPFMQGLRKMGESARNHVGVVRDELQTLALEPMPSAQAEAFIEAVKVKAVEAAKEVADARDKIINPVITEDDTTKEDEESQRLAAHLKNMEDLRAEHGGAISGLVRGQWGDNVADTALAGKKLVGVMAANNKKAFEASKAYALGDAAISMYQGIAAGVRLGYPAAIPAVAMAAATGIKQINSIRNQKFGGPGGAAAAGGGTPAQAPNPVGVGGTPQQQQTLTVAPIDPSGIYSGAAMQQFGESIYDFSKDGGKVVFDA